MFLRHLLLAATLLVPLTDSALADRHDRHRNEEGQQREERSSDDKPRREMTLDQAVKMVQRRYDAKVISTETRREGGRTVYRLKLLNKEGKVWTVNVDASGG